MVFLIPDMVFKTNSLVSLISFKYLVTNLFKVSLEIFASLVNSSIKLFLTFSLVLRASVTNWTSYDSKSWEVQISPSITVFPTPLGPVIINDFVSGVSLSKTSITCLKLLSL